VDKYVGPSLSITGYRQHAFLTLASRWTSVRTIWQTCPNRNIRRELLVVIMGITFLERLVLMCGDAGKHLTVLMQVL